MFFRLSFVLLLAGTLIGAAERSVIDCKNLQGHRLAVSVEEEQNDHSFPKWTLQLLKGDQQVDKAVLYDGFDQDIKVEIRQEVYKINDTEYAVDARVRYGEYGSNKYNNQFERLSLFRVSPNGLTLIFDENVLCKIEHLCCSEEEICTYCDDKDESVLSVLPSVTLGFRDLFLETNGRKLVEPYTSYWEPNTTGKENETPIYEHHLKRTMFFWDGSKYVSN